MEILLKGVLQKDVLLNERDVNDKTPFHVAAENGSLHCVEVLAHFTFLLDERAEGAVSALHLAANNKHAWVTVRIPKHVQHTLIIRTLSCVIVNHTKM